MEMMGEWDQEKERRARSQPCHVRETKSSAGGSSVKNVGEIQSDKQHSPFVDVNVEELGKDVMQQGEGHTATATVVVAKADVSKAGSDFTFEHKTSGHMVSVDSAADVEIPIDVRTRPTCRVDSDASQQSVSEQSVVTADSGVWTKATD